MQFGMGFDVSWMREELTRLGIEELTTTEAVDQAMDQAKEGTSLLVINSVCGCAAANARPGVAQALELTQVNPDRMFTVFAGQDKEATAQARSYFSQFPPSSPSFAFFKDGEIKALIPRQRIEGRTAEQVSEDLLLVFNTFCGEEVQD